MHTGIIGTIAAIRRPANVLIISGGRASSDIRNDQLTMGVSVTIGNYHLQNGIALFDTGSTETVLFLPDFRNRIGLDPFDHGLAKGMDGMFHEVNYYESVIKFQCGFEINTDLIDVFDHRPDIANIIIGMDIIKKGKLTVDGIAGTFIFEI